MAPFCSCPASLVSRKFFAVGPGCAKCFFFCCAPLGAATFRRGQSRKKNTTQGVFFFAPAPGRRSPVGRRHGARAKKKTPPRVFFFCSGPGERQGKEKPRWKPAWGQSKKKNTTQGVFFFLLWPRAGAQRGFSFPCRSRGRSKKNTLGGVFFLLWPRAGAQRVLLPLPFAGPAAKKKHPGGVFFLLWPRAGAQRGFSFPCLSPGPQQKKKYPGWCFFFCCGPARTLTHSLRAWVAMPPPRRGGVFFFAAAPPGPGWCFFLLLWPRPDAHSLTVGWGDFGKARVVFFFFCCGPAGSF